MIYRNPATDVLFLGRFTLELTHISHVRFAAKGSVCPKQAGMWRGRAVTP